jgi:predicted enzyme related to lactoylglutathione lyase
MSNRTERRIPVTVLATFARVYVDDLDAALPTFVGLTGEQPRLRFSYGELELARIGGYLLLAGSPEALAPFRGTQATTIVDSLDGVLDLVRRHGGDILSGPKDVPTGRNLTVRHPGGATIEYVEFHEEARATLG